MTEEILNKALDLKRKMEKYKSFLKAYNSPYSNKIEAYNFDGNKESSMTILLENEPELEMRIREYVMHKIEFLEQEFAKLGT